MGDLLAYLPASSVGIPPPPRLAEARAGYEASIPGKLAVLRHGALPAVDPSLRFRLRIKLADEFEPSPTALDGQSYAGLALRAAAGRARASLSFLVGLQGAAGRQWGVAAGVTANPFDTFLAEAELRLWGDFGAPSSFFPVPASLELLAALSWSSVGEMVVFRPDLSGSLEYDFAAGDIDWTARGGIAAETGLGDGARPVGAWAGFLSARGGAFAEGRPGSPGWGPELNLKAGVAKIGAATFGAASLRGRVSGRFDASGVGVTLDRGDVYRGAAPSGAAPLAATASVELAWLAKPLEFDAGEILLVKDMEIGPYLDCAWLAADGSGALPDAFAAGLAYSTTLSFAGLAPLNLSLFLGFDGSGSLAFGIRSGRLFPVMK
jgi:hypothetical protein